MKDKKTGLTIRTLDATEKYIAEHIVKDNSNYTFPQALRDAGYKNSYVDSFSDKIWDNIAVQGKIASFKAKVQAKTEINAAEVITGLREIAFPDDGVRVSNADKLRALELLGKTLALYTDNLNQTDTIKQRELDEKEQAEAQRIATIRLNEQLRPHTPLN